MTAWFPTTSTPPTAGQSLPAAPQRCAGIVPPPPRCRRRPLSLVVPTAGKPQPTESRESAWHRIRIATTGSIRHVQEWMDEHCEGRWHVGVTGVDKYLATKFAEVHFERIADKQRFKAMFAAHSAVAA